MSNEGFGSIIVPLLLPSSMIVGLFLLGVSLASRVSGVAPHPVAQPQPTLTRTTEMLDRLPLRFEENRGLVDQRVRFFARAGRRTLALTAAGAFLLISGESETLTIGIRFIGANGDSQIAGLQPLPGSSHYLVGDNPADWHRNVGGYAEVKYEEVYRGIDVVYHGNQNQFEYDFHILPGANPAAIRFQFEGGGDLSLDSDGALVLATGLGEIRHHKPFVYQQSENGIDVVPGRYVVEGGKKVGFEVGPYDASRTLVIDPVVSYAAVVGGRNFDVANSIAVDNAGNAYIAGFTTSLEFPVANAFQGGAGRVDGFVTKLNAAGDAIIFSTYLGGSGDDRVFDIAMDARGQAYLAGSTNSPDFPTANPFQRTGGRAFPDAFVTKVSADGSSLIFSTYLGGGLSDEAGSIDIDAAGSVYVSGVTASSDFPKARPLQANYGGGVSDAFVSKFDSSGSTLVFSTYVGGSNKDEAHGIGVDSAGNVYIAGLTDSENFPIVSAVQSSLRGIAQDAFVAKLNPAGSSLVYSTYLGGTGEDGARGLAVDGPGNAYLTGWTESKDFPTMNPFQDGLSGPADVFVSKLAPTGSLVYSTYLGGGWTEFGNAIAVDSSGAAYITGFTDSRDFPVLRSLQADRVGDFDVFVSALDSTGSNLKYSTYIGSFSNNAGNGIALDSGGTAYIAGASDGFRFSTVFRLLGPEQARQSGNFPDAFVLKLADDSSGVRPFSVRPLEGLVWTSDPVSDALISGFVRIHGNGKTPPAAALGILEFRQDGELASEAVIPSILSVRSARIPAETTPSVNTGLAIANPNGMPVSVSFSFTGVDGRKFGAGETRIDANHKIAAFLDQPPFNGQAPIRGTFTFSASLPVAAVAIRMRAGERSRIMLTTIPAIPVGTDRRVRPEIVSHFADGGGWSTEAILVNAEESDIRGRLQFLGQGGAFPAQPVNVTIGDRLSDVFEYSIPARSVQRFETSGAGDAVRAGSIRILPAAGTMTPHTMALVSLKKNGVVLTESVIPAVFARPSYLLYVERKGGVGRAGSLRTAVAIANPSSSQANVNLELMTLAATPMGHAAKITVPVNGQIARFLDEISALGPFPSPFQGLLRVTADPGSPMIAVTGLRAHVNESGDFLISTIPVIAEDGFSKSSEPVLPHFVLGGGYTTNLVFVNAGPSVATGSVSFLNAFGQHMNWNPR